MCELCTKDENKIREFGRTFGYPDCCIEEFVSDTKFMNDTGVDVRNDMQITVAINTFGFVPCKVHAEMIICGQITPEDLIIERRNIKKSNRLNKLVSKH